VDRRRQLSFCATIIGMTIGPLLGCHQRVFVPPGADAATADATGSDGLAPLTLDIAVTGCATLTITTIATTTNVVCTGTAPLTVSFSPVGSAELTEFLWDFGDRTPPSSDRAPTHTYTLPTSYTVRLTGDGSVGSVTQQRRSLIVVQPVATGASCDIDGQCGNGLRCLCQPGAGCGTAFLRGICSTSCPTGFCGAGAACAAYAPGAPIDAGLGTDAGAPLCLASCSTSADCPAGLVCENLLAGAPSTATWVRGCLPVGAAGDLGASCRNANGLLVGTHCTTGLCTNFGTLGLCSATCDDDHPCPSGAGCAHFATGQQICLPTCSATSPCSTDPSIICRTATGDAGASAAAGFQITGNDAGATYCAPMN
jgi:PKD repeat protein